MPVFEITWPELLACVDAPTPEARTEAAANLHAKRLQSLAGFDGVVGKYHFTSVTPSAGVRGHVHLPAFMGMVRYVANAPGFHQRVVGGTLAERLRYRAIWDGAAPGSPFRQDPIAVSLVDSTKLPEYSVSAAQFTTHGPGTFRVQFAGRVHSFGLDDPTTISLGVAVNGVVVATNSKPRPLTPAPASQGDMVEFDTDDVVVLASPSTITLVNAGAYEQTAYGILRILPS